MGSSFIESAYYGDEKSMRNITASLGDKITGTTLDVGVDEKLIPAFEVSEKTELSSLEEKNLRNMASKTCGGVDQECINATEARLRQEKLAEKERSANSAVGVIKGRRLTVNILDADGKRRRVVVPDGQKFKLDNVAIGSGKDGKSSLPTLKYAQTQLYMIAGIVLGTIVYVFGIIATYTIFAPRFGLPVAIPMTVISVVVPYSGYMMIFFYFMFKSAVDTYVGSQ